MRVALIDAVNILRRDYEAMPSEPGVADGAARSALSYVLRTLRTVQPTHAVAVFDGGGRGWRHALYPGYKANRPLTPAPVREAIEALQQGASGLGLATARVPGVEADDVIASITGALSVRTVSTVIVSSDRGFAQLLGERVVLYDHVNGVYRDAAWALEHFGAAPERLAELTALAGNPTDNLPGVPGIGPKTAARLLREHGSLDAVLENADGIGGRTGERLREHAGSLRLWLRLARLRADVTLGLTMAGARVPAALLEHAPGERHGV
jgi:DNA polymerase-1